MKLKGTKKIKKIIKNFLLENGFGEFDIEIGNDFAYYHSYDTELEPPLIVFSLVALEDSTFLTNLYRRYKPSFVCDVALISFFHELGHHETWNMLTEEEHTFYNEQKKWIEEYINTVEDNQYVHDMYFGCADEDMATRWAIDYISKNAEMVASFWNDLAAAIQRFYKKNGVDIESTL